MADHFYGTNIGDGADPSGISTGTSTTSKNVELRVADGVSGNNKTEVIKAVERILAKLMVSDAPA